MRTRHVIVQPHNPEWKGYFTQLSLLFSSWLGNEIIKIEHVGSTSVPNLAAKPIIDLDIVIQRKNFRKVKEILENNGYVHEGNLGIEDRDAFKPNSPKLLKNLPNHHLYVCPDDSQQLHAHLLFRDFLRFHPFWVEKYGNLKTRLAKLFPHDIDQYMTNKHQLVQQILEEAHHWENSKKNET